MKSACFVLSIGYAIGLCSVGTAQEVNERAYQEYGKYVAKTVQRMRGVTQNITEASDLKALEFLLREYDEAVADRNWAKARSTGTNMKIYLDRGGKVAAQADVRKEARLRAEQERRHQEELKQKERHHQEQLRQGRLLEQRLRYLEYLHSRRP